MLAKILMGSCYVNKFHSEGNEYVKKLTPFHSKCNKKHLLYVLFCNNYPHGDSQVLQFGGKCTCAIKFAFHVWDFCTRVKYLLNYKVNKFYLKSIPEGG